MIYKCPICKKEFYPYPEHRDCALKFTQSQYLEVLDHLWNLYEETVGELQAAQEYN